MLDRLRLVPDEIENLGLQIFDAYRTRELKIPRVTKVTYSTLIHGWVTAGDVQRGEHWLLKMQKYDITPNAFCFNSAPCCNLEVG